MPGPDKLGEPLLSLLLLGNGLADQGLSDFPHRHPTLGSQSVPDLFLRQANLAAFGILVEELLQQGNGVVACGRVQQAQLCKVLVDA